MNKFISSVVKNKCPNCLGDNFFVYNNIYSFSKFDKMNQACTKCGMDFRQEPGFYFGAAIMSYAMQAVLLLISYLMLQVLIELPFWYFLGTFSVLLIVLMPFTFRISRLLWINILGTRPKQ
jgi:uncharacterized protein (DUF983 family)